MKNKVLKKLLVSTLATGIALIGMIALWPDSPTAAFVGHLAQYDLFTDYHHQPPEPSLVINHTIGQQGSYFRITGTNYPAFNTALVTVNQQLLGTVSLDSSGATVFQLRTTNADDGVYLVTVTAAVDPPADKTQITTEPMAETVFTIHPDAPFRSSTVNTIIFEVPTGIALNNHIYFPTMYK